MHRYRGVEHGGSALPLVYRAVLDDVDDRIVDSVERLFAAWLRSKGLVSDDFRFEPGMSQALASSDLPAWIQRRTASLGSGTGQLHRIRLVEEASDARWTTTALWTTRAPGQQQSEAGPTGRERLSTAEGVSHGHWVWLDLEHEPFGGRPVRPGSPRFVRDLMAAGEAHDGRLPLTAEALLVTAGHVSELVGYIRDPARRLPIVVFADDPQHAYDQERLARQLARDLAGVAAVFRLGDGAATQSFAAALPEDYRVFGGALRTYLPKALTPGDLSSRHRVLGRTSITTLGPRAFPAVKDQILQLSAHRPGPLDAVVVRRMLAEPAPTGHALAGDGPASRTDALLGWFGRQIHRIRRQRGQDDGLSPESLSVARRALASEIDRLLDARDDGGPAGIDVAASDELDGLRADLAKSEADREVLNQLLSEAEGEARVAGESVRRLSEDADYLQLELAEVVRESDTARRRIRWLESRIQEFGKPAWTQPVDELTVPASVAEVLELARDRLTNVVIGETDADAAELDVHPGADLFAVKTWNALVALDEFAAAVKAGRYNGNFYLWCQQQPAGASGISATAVSLVESESVDNHPLLRGRRVFSVPRSVARDGHVYMPAHIKIVRQGAPAPRLHFHDDTRGTTRMVHVGYVGAHLPTAQFK